MYTVVESDSVKAFLSDSENQKNGHAEESMINPERY